MSRFATDYHVSRSSGQCAATGAALEPGETCIAALCERADDESLDRLDYSMEAWQSGRRPERLFSYWRFTVPDPAAKGRLVLDDAVLSDLFERLSEDRHPHRIAFRFVLGLILLRKRLVRFEGRSTRLDNGEEIELWLMRPKGADPDQPPIELRNPRLTDDDVRELTTQLSEIFQSEL